MKEHIHTINTFKLTMQLFRLMMLTVFFLAMYDSAFAASPKQSSVIKGDYVTLSDVFDGIKHNASYVLAPAPKPGEELVLDVRSLLRISQAFGLDWQPNNQFERVVITRSGTLISHDDILHTLHEALKKEGAGDNFNIKLSQEDASLVIPSSNAATLNVTHVKLRPLSGAFEATLSVTDAQAEQKTLHLNGMVQHLTAVPVLKQRLRNGDIIKAGDIDWINVPSNDIPHNLVVNKDRLVGMTPRKSLRAQQPIRVTELEAPRIVERGDKVTIFLNTGTVKLSARGKALQDGAKGDFIRVVNLSSSRVVEAFVSGARQVEIATN